MPNFCCTCMHWEGGILKSATDEFGICHEPTASKKVIQDSDTKLNEGSTVYCERYFGCIYHREQSLLIVDTSAAIKNKLK